MYKTALKISILSLFILFVLPCQKLLFAQSYLYDLEAQKAIEEIEDRYKDILVRDHDGIPIIREDAPEDRVQAIGMDILEALKERERRVDHAVFIREHNRLRPVRENQLLEAIELSRKLEYSKDSSEEGIFKRITKIPLRVGNRVLRYESTLERFERDERIRSELLAEVYEGRADTLEKAVEFLDRDDVRDYVLRLGLGPYPKRDKFKAPYGYEAFGVVKDPSTEYAPADAFYAIIQSRKASPLMKGAAREAYDYADMLERTVLAVPLSESSGLLQKSFDEGAHNWIKDLVDEENIAKEVSSQMDELKREVKTFAKELGLSLSEDTVVARAYELSQFYKRKICEEDYRRRLLDESFKLINWDDPALAEHINRTSDLKVTPEILKSGAKIYDDIHGITGGIFNPSAKEGENVARKALWLAFLIPPARALSGLAANLSMIGLKAGLRYLTTRGIVRQALLDSVWANRAMAGVSLAAGAYTFPNATMGMASLWEGDRAFDHYDKQLFMGMLIYGGMQGSFAIVNTLVRNAYLSRVTALTSPGNPMANPWSSYGVTLSQATRVAKAVNFFAENGVFTGAQYLEPVLYGDTPAPKSLKVALTNSLLTCLYMRAGNIMHKSVWTGVRIAWDESAAMRSWLANGIRNAGSAGASVLNPLPVPVMNPDGSLALGNPGRYIPGNNLNPNGGMVSPSSLFNQFSGTPPEDQKQYHSGGSGKPTGGAIPSSGTRSDKSTPPTVYTMGKPLPADNAFARCVVNILGECTMQDATSPINNINFGTLSQLQALVVRAGLPDRDAMILSMVVSSVRKKPRSNDLLSYVNDFLESAHSDPDQMLLGALPRGIQLPGKEAGNAFTWSQNLIPSIDNVPIISNLGEWHEYLRGIPRHIIFTLPDSIEAGADVINLLLILFHEGAHIADIERTIKWIRANLSLPEPSRDDLFKKYVRVRDEDIYEIDSPFRSVLDEGRAYQVNWLVLNNVLGANNAKKYETRTEDGKLMHGIEVFKHMALSSVASEHGNIEFAGARYNINEINSQFLAEHGINVNNIFDVVNRWAKTMDETINMALKIAQESSLVEELSTFLSLVPDAQARFDKAASREVCNRELTNQNKIGILKAHLIGKGPNYTKAELEEKERILRDHGFSLVEARRILRQRIAGVGFPVEPGNGSEQNQPYPNGGAVEPTFPNHGQDMATPSGERSSSDLPLIYMDRKPLDPEGVFYKHLLSGLIPQNFLLVGKDIHAGSISNLKDIFTDSGVPLEHAATLSETIASLVALPDTGDILSFTLETLREDPDIFKVVLLPKGFVTGHGGGAEAGHIPKDFIATPFGHSGIPETDPAMKLSLAKIIPPVVVLSQHEWSHPGTTLLDYLCNFFHEATHIADDSLISRWIRANLSLKAKERDILFKRFVRTDTAHGIPEIDASFRLILTEGRAYNVEWTLLTRIAGPEKAQSMQSIYPDGTTATGEASFRSDVLQSVDRDRFFHTNGMPYDIAEQNAAIVREFKISATNIFEVVQGWTDTIKGTIERAEQITGDGFPLEPGRGGEQNQPDPNGGTVGEPADLTPPSPIQRMGTE